MTDTDQSKPLITGDAGVLIDAYDCIELLAAREDDWPAQTLAAVARVVADLWNDPDPYAARMAVEEAWPELAAAMWELLAGGPCHPPLTLADVRNADER